MLVCHPGQRIEPGPCSACKHNSLHFDLLKLVICVLICKKCCLNPILLRVDKFRNATNRPNSEFQITALGAKSTRARAAREHANRGQLPSGTVAPQKNHRESDLS